MKNDIIKNFSNNEIYHIFRSNKRILLFLIEEQIFILDSLIIKKIKNAQNQDQLIQYFEPEIEKVENNNKMKMNADDFKKFNEKRKIGENDDELCKIVRNDLIEDFIIYINKYDISLNIIIDISIFETNSYLIENAPTLIEYAAFFGSIQIFKYLYLNDVKLSDSLLLYAIHGNNPELIHFLENKNIVPSDEKYLNESIKCHHNDIANYIQYNYLQEEEENKFQFNVSKVLKFYNFAFIQDELADYFFYLCKYDYSYLVEFILKTMDININELTILNIHFLNKILIINDFNTGKKIPI